MLLCASGAACGARAAPSPVLELLETPYVSAPSRRLETPYEALRDGDEPRT